MPDLRNALAALPRTPREQVFEPKTGEDGGGGEGDEEIEREHAATIGPAMAHGVSLRRSRERWHALPGDELTPRRGQSPKAIDA